MASIAAWDWRSLAQALQAGQLDTAELLLQHGARPEHAMPNGPSAVNVAAAARCLPCLELLRRHGADLNPPVPSAAFALWLDAAPLGSPTSSATPDQLAALGLRPSAAGLVHSALASKENLCWLLANASLGERDTSKDREDSWHGLMMLLDAGLQPPSCSGHVDSELRRGISRRLPEQTAMWANRIGDLRPAGVR